MKKITIMVEGNKADLDYDFHFYNLIKISESLNKGAAKNYQKMGLTYVDVPEIVGITGACENVDTLFKVYNRFDLPLFFTQTGQLSLEQALQSIHGAYTVIHSGRDEEKEDMRHLRQFRLTEEEFDCSYSKMNNKNYDEEKMFSALLDHIQFTIQAMIKEILKDNRTILKNIYKRNPDKLETAAKKNFLRIDYKDALKLLNDNGYPNLLFGDDLKADHEAKVVALLNKKNEQLPVFITRYPKEIKFFNKKVSTKDSRVVLSADLIFPYSGEGVGSAVREHNFHKLDDRLRDSTMYKLHLQRGGTYDDFKWYLDIIKEEKSLPHAGYGIGNERVLQYILGFSDIRQASVFSLLAKQTGDWDKSRYGQAGIMKMDKKHILISIGKVEDKKILSPYIEKLSKYENYILYATEKTHLYFKEKGIMSSWVYKISEIGQMPNIADLLNRRVFDYIINIPTRDKIDVSKEFTDGKLIRKGAIQMGINLITDPEVAISVIENLIRSEND